MRRSSFTTPAALALAFVLPASAIAGDEADRSDGIEQVAVVDSGDVSWTLMQTLQLDDYDGAVVIADVVSDAAADFFVRYDVALDDLGPLDDFEELDSIVESRVPVILTNMPAPLDSRQASADLASRVAVDPGPDAWVGLLCDASQPEACELASSPEMETWIEWLTSPDLIDPDDQDDPEDTSTETEDTSTESSSDDSSDTWTEDESDDTWTEEAPEDEWTEEPAADEDDEDEWTSTESESSSFEDSESETETSLDDDESDSETDWSAQGTQAAEDDSGPSLEVLPVM